MKLGQVIGTVVATQKDDKLRGLRFLVLRKLDAAGEPLPGDDDYVVAVDPLGTGFSEVVLYVLSSSARFASTTLERPVDAVIVGIVDAVEHDGALRYDKSVTSGERS